MNKKGIGVVAMVAIVLGIAFILIVVFQGPGLMKYVNEKFFSGALKPFESKIEGTKAGKGVANIVYLSDNPFTATEQLANETRDCWLKFEMTDFTSQSCGIMAPPAKWDDDSFVMVGEGRPIITYDNVLEKLKKMPKSPKGYVYASKLDWGLETPIAEGGGAFYICGNNDWINEVHITREDFCE